MRLTTPSILLPFAEYFPVITQELVVLPMHLKLPGKVFGKNHSRQVDLPPPSTYASIVPTYVSICQV